MINVKNKILDRLGLIDFKSIIYLLITVIAILFPMIVKLLYLIISMKSNFWDTFDEFAMGDFYLYTISLLMPIIYVVQCIINREYTNIKGKMKIPFGQAMTVLSISAILYIINFILHCENDKVINSKFICLTSIALFIWSIVIAYRIHIFESTTKEPNEIREENENILKNEMKKIKEGEEPSYSKKGKYGVLEIEFNEQEDLN